MQILHPCIQLTKLYPYLSYNHNYLISKSTTNYCIIELNLASDSMSVLSFDRMQAKSIQTSKNQLMTLIRKQHAFLMIS